MQTSTPPAVSCQTPLLCLAAIAASAVACLADPIPLETFDTRVPGLFDKGFVDFWRWSDSQRSAARAGSRLEIIPDPAMPANRLLRVRIEDARVFADGAKPILRLAPYFPPEADAVRLRVKVLAGRLTMHLGGPTAYYGNSDAWTQSRELAAADTPEWIEIEFSLNHDLTRNQRRAGFSAGSPRVYYSRWAQEPMGVYLGAGSRGVLLIDRIDLVARGEGRPFPEFREEDIEPVHCLADFEDGNLDAAATFYFAATEAEWFEESWLRRRPLRFTPMVMRLAPAGPGGGTALESSGPTAEEVHAAAWRAAGVDGANAVSFTLKVDVPGRQETLAGGGPVAPVDLLIFVAPRGTKFPWEALAAPPEWKAAGGMRGFDYQFVHRTIAPRDDLHFAIYHARRYLPPGEVVRICVTAADFAVIHGQGAMRQRFLGNAPLDLGELIAVAWVNPWARSGRREVPVTTTIDRIDLVRVPGTPVRLRSFWQLGDGKNS